MPRPGNSSERGYDQEHRRLREQLRPEVEAGLHRCARCREPIFPGEAWDLDHAENRQGYIGPSHRSCNRSAGAQKRNGTGHDTSPPPSRRW